MELIDASIVRRKFSDSVLLSFRSGARIVGKRINVASSAQISRESEIIRQVRKAVREAHRDFLYMEHGEKWRDFDSSKGVFFTAETTDEEKALCSTALDLIGVK